MARKEKIISIRISKIAPVLFRVLGAFTPIFFERFLGSEGTAIMTTPSGLLLLLVFIFGFIFFFRCVKKKRKGFLLLFLFFYIVLFLFFYLVRLQFCDFFCKGAIAFVILGVASGEIIPTSSGPSHSTSWTEDSFEVGVLMEPFSDTEMGGTSARSSIPRVAGCEAGPSASTEVIPEPLGVTPNISFESSIRKRIIRLEDANSIFLLDKGRGEYWSEIKAELAACSSQEEYNENLEFESRDLQIREMKTECYSLVREIVFNQPALMADSWYSTPETAVSQFFDDTRTDLEAEKDPSKLGFHYGETDRAEIRIYKKVAKDLRQNGPESFYLKKILGFFD